MGQTTDEIKHEIEQTRSRLGQEINELEYRVKRAADWRVHFDRHPWWFVGAAFAGALLIGLAAGNAANRSY
jgi:ElaB/YqjD/DUF883 family membrane-anchored ribosome-binding protein